MSDDLLFVYGTLRRGIVSPLDELMAQHCEFHADATMQGILFDVAGYPGAITSTNPANRVIGELYAVRRPRQLWPRLDHYEHCSNAFPKPHEYVRKMRTFSLENGEDIRAWVYLFNWKSGGLFRVQSGDYLQYLRGESEETL